MLGCDVNRMMQFCDSLIVVCHDKHNDSQNAKDWFDILLQNIFLIFCRFYDMTRLENGVPDISIPFKRQNCKDRQKRRTIKHK